MYREYDIVSPSLEGILIHDFTKYTGITRPSDIIQILDGPATRSISKIRHDGQKMNQEQRKELEQYFQDLYGIFMKNISYFVIASNFEVSETVRLQAMLQEMFKIKAIFKENTPTLTEK